MICHFVFFYVQKKKLFSISRKVFNPTWYLIITERATSWYVFMETRLMIGGLCVFLRKLETYAWKIQITRKRKREYRHILRLSYVTQKFQNFTPQLSTNHIPTLLCFLRILNLIIHPIIVQVYFANYHNMLFVWFVNPYIT